MDTVQPHSSLDILPCLKNLTRQVQQYQLERTVILNGTSLSIPAVVVVSRNGIHPVLDLSREVRERVNSSRKALEDAVTNQKSIYGVTTGIGSSGGMRSDDTTTAGVAMIESFNCGVLPTDGSDLTSSGMRALEMPEAWIRGAILLRANSLLRGFSGVRWEVIEMLSGLLTANITPVVPLRGSISASGDLVPLAYIAGTLTGNPHIKVHHRVTGARLVSPSRDALEAAGIKPLKFLAKEPLSLVNGTAACTSVGAIAVYDAAQLALLSIVCTAMAHEVLQGSKGSFASFLHDVARPHPGQVEISRCMLHLLESSKLAKDHDNSSRLSEDQGVMRQDRYALRTFPQYIGPQLEDIYAAIQSITIECNAASDNPVIEVETDTIHLGGNFQAMSVTNAMEKTRFALDHIGKILFGQSTELMGTDMNKGLPISLAATDPSTNFHMKGLEVAMASYVAELGYLAGPVSTHAKVAEQHTQSVNSMALVSGRATLSAIETLGMFIASYLYMLCHAIDLRVMQLEFMESMADAMVDDIRNTLKLASDDSIALAKQLDKPFRATLSASSSMDLGDQMQAVASSTIPVIVKFFVENASSSSQPGLEDIHRLSVAFKDKGCQLMTELRHRYLADHVPGKTLPASSYLGRTKAVYAFIRGTLGIPMHGKENLKKFGGKPYVDSKTIGENVSLIFQAIMDGKLHQVVADIILP